MSPSPGDHPDRTIPEWLDPQNLHGRLYFMILKAADGHTLPKNPFLIGRSIDKHAGKIEGAFYEHSKKWYVLKIRNKDQGRHLTLLKELLDGTPIEVGRHPSLNQRKFVVRCSEAEGMTDQDLLVELASQKIIDVRCITKKTVAGIVRTPTFILTINSTIIPEFVNFGLLRVRTRVYIPQPLLCRLCFQYGHSKKRCTNDRVCSICCSSMHDSQSCPGTKFCVSCKKKNLPTNHSPTDRSCPIWMTESQILQMSAEKNMPLSTARREVEKKSSSTSYADITRRGSNKSPIISSTAPISQHEKTETKNLNDQKNAHHTRQSTMQQKQQHEDKGQQQQKRNRSTTEPPVLLLSVDSPPRKKSPSRLVRGSTTELSIEVIPNANDDTTSASICADSSPNNPNPSPHSPPLNPFQPPQPPSFKLKLSKPPAHEYI